MVSYNQAILLAASRHWKHSAKTPAHWCYASMRFDDVIKRNGG